MNKSTEVTKATLITRYAQWITRHPWLVMLAALLVVMAAASGGKYLAFKTDYRVFFDLNCWPSNPWKPCTPKMTM